MNHRGCAQEEMQKKVEKWQELPPAKQTRVLAKPDMEPKSRRGGARLRKMKERFGMTDMRKEQNRMEFGKACLYLYSSLRL